MSFKDNLEKLFQKQNLFLFSILFTLNFYYFKFSLFESINFKIKLPELIYLFLFQIIFFLSLKKIILKISNLNIRKILDLFFNAWFLVILIQTCFFFYGGISLNDFLESIFKNLNFHNSIILKPITIFFPYFFAFLLIYFLSKKKYSFLKFFKITTFVLLIFFFYREIFLYPDSYFPNIIDKKPVYQKSFEIKDNEPITLWVLFDEYDPKFISELKIENNLKYFNQLKKESLYFEKIIPNAKQTKFSMMGILTGFNFVDLRIRNKEVFLLNDNKESLKYDFEKTIFQKLLDNNNKFTILSTVTKYCSMYFKNYDLKNCNEFSKNINFFNQLSIFNKENYRGIFFHYSLLSYVNTFLNMLSSAEIIIKDNSENYQRIVNLKSDLEVNDFDGNNFITSDKITNLISKRQHSLIFAHVNLPHLPSTYSEKMLNFNLDDNDIYENYLLNLKYNDLVIKKLLEIQKKNKNINLIISSDHWFRVKDMKSKTYYESLLAVRLSNDMDYIKVDEKYNASIIFSILESIIINKSESYKSIIDDLSGVKYSEPCYNKNCLD